MKLARSILVISVVVLFVLSCAGKIGGLFAPKMTDFELDPVFGMLTRRTLSIYTVLLQIVVLFVLVANRELHRSCRLVASVGVVFLPITSPSVSLATRGAVVFHNHLACHFSQTRLSTK